MTAITHPQFREMTIDESRALLTSKHVGRVAFTLANRVDIEPISYASDGEWVFGRTSPGTKLASLLHRPWCAFETDEVRDLFDWSSVVVQGTFYLLDPESGQTDTYQRAERLLKEVIPGTFTAKDPVPFRAIVFGIYAHHISGRSAHH